MSLSAAVLVHWWVSLPIKCNVEEMMRILQFMPSSVQVASLLAPFFDTEGAKNRQSVLVLFFSASWCKPANDKTQSKLRELIQPKKIDIPCLVLSADLDQIQFNEHVEELTWAEIFSLTRRDELIQIYRHFGINAVPHVLVIDREMNVLSTDKLQVLLNLDREPSIAEKLESLLHPEPEGVENLAADDPMLHEMRKNANIRYDEGDFHGAASIFSEVLALSPQCARSNFNMAVILHTMGQTHLAVQYMLNVIEVDPNDATAHSVLRTVFFTPEPDLVLRGYEDIVKRHPDHVRATHSLAALRGDATTSEARYVRQVFDDLSDTFEEKLVQHLHYKVPWQLLDLVKSVTPLETSKQSWRVVDLGCGTGLCGRLFKPFVQHIVGVDLSPLMIEKSRATACYDALYADDLLPVLHALPDASMDLVLSADVWIYVGALELVFQACRRVMKPDGNLPSSKPSSPATSSSYLAFSIEEFHDTVSPDEPHLEYQLVHSGRFQHSRRYIERLANDYSFRVVAAESIVVRHESVEPIPGVLYVLEAV
ncbi:hypothetical protein Ae201684P_006252 [Aphanomyces euteiches]|uniref:Uncharacterized protein n=1 Tax=Aphanomyces euteiches TaxID=100861 RepID=A0A6G0XB03_9STRA|nr:hypothetical protein Ae201684_006464 [Aphanomyces euteiches]KAH9090848.1 hypothetical protein Ae201684P_006252 [Aphanomyces euteiches]